MKRRRVFRALIGYGIVAFAVLQIVEPVMHGLRWPDAVLSYVVIALALGFSIVVGLAWIFDVRAGGIERTPSGATPARAARHSRSCSSASEPSPPRPASPGTSSYAGATRRG